MSSLVTVNVNFSLLPSPNAVTNSIPASHHLLSTPPAEAPCFIKSRKFSRTSREVTC